MDGAKVKFNLFENNSVAIKANGGKFVGGEDTMKYNNFIDDMINLQFWRFHKNKLINLWLMMNE